MTAAAKSRQVYNRRTQAYSLIEALIAIGIIGLLAFVGIAAFRSGRTAANRTACLSNQRQIGAAMLMYASDHYGMLPKTTHTTGRRFNRNTESWSNESAWINQLSPYLANIDAVRVCPADPLERRRQILKATSAANRATSYVLNELVVDLPDPESPQQAPVFYDRLTAIPQPSRTMLLFILSEDREISATWDHTHSSEWTTWQAVCNDIEVDRHRSGARSESRTEGSTNILYADGHAENIPAETLKSIVDSGLNPAAVPKP